MGIDQIKVSAQTFEFFASRSRGSIREFISSQIVQQAATAVLAQANLSQKSVLDLLKDIYL